jgi:leader peptidase (prepilin peptidase)/N-methyltransferase
MLVAYITCLAALLGLAFGSFLNVCASRMPEGESIVSPGSHCRNCGQPIRWYENIPLASWIFLRGRCSNCGAGIGLRYPLVELAVAFTWAVIVRQALDGLLSPQMTTTSAVETCLIATGNMVLCWLLILLATLDAEHFWLPNRITLGGAALGVPFALVRFGVHWVWPLEPARIIKGLEAPHNISGHLMDWLLGIVIAPSIILFVRWSYRLVRRREGIGLGDAKLMLLLGVWLGLAHTLVAFFLGVLLGTAFSFVLLVAPRTRRDDASWLLNRIPLGTFLCFGGILSALWGSALIDEYLHVTGF